MSSHTDPDFLNELEEEAQFLNSRRRQSDRFQLKEPGENAVIRFLPYEFDDKQRWYARIGRHWVNKRPYVCTAITRPDHGGDPDGRCPICDLVNDLNMSRDKSVSDKAYRMMAGPQYLTYVLVYEMSSASGALTKTPLPELHHGREFWLYQNDFQEVMTLYKSFLRRSRTPLSILDPVDGCDLFVEKSRRRGLRFDREDPAPIAPDGHDVDEFLSKALKTIRWKPDAPVTGDDLEDLLVKIEDTCEGGGRSSRSSRSRMDVDEDEEPRRGRGRSSRRDEDEDEPRRRSSRVEEEEEPQRGSRRSSRRDEEEPPARSSRSSRSHREEEEEPPARSSRSSRSTQRREEEEEPPARSSRRSSRHEEEEPPARSRREDPPPPPRNRDPIDDGDEDDVPYGREEEEEPPPPVRGSSSRRQLPPPPPAAVSSSTPRRTARDEDEDGEDGNIPEGDRETAPAEGPTEGEMDEDQKTEAAEKPAETPVSRGAGLSRSIRDRVSRFDNKS